MIEIKEERAKAFIFWLSSFEFVYSDWQIGNGLLCFAGGEAKWISVYFAPQNRCLDDNKAEPDGDSSIFHFAMWRTA